MAVSSVAAVHEQVHAHHEDHAHVRQGVQDVQPVVGDQVHGGCGNEDEEQGLLPRPGRPPRRELLGFGKSAHTLSIALARLMQ